MPGLRRDARCRRAGQRAWAAVSRSAPCFVASTWQARCRPARTGRPSAATRSRPPRRSPSSRCSTKRELAEGAKTEGEFLSRALSAVCSAPPDLVGPERGLGSCAPCLSMASSPRSVLASLRDRGVLVIIAGDTGLRICPPLVVTRPSSTKGCAFSTRCSPRYVVPRASTPSEAEP